MGVLLSSFLITQNTRDRGIRSSYFALRPIGGSPPLLLLAIALRAMGGSQILFHSFRSRPTLATRGWDSSFALFLFSIALRAIGGFSDSPPTLCDLARPAIGDSSLATDRAARSGAHFDSPSALVSHVFSAYLRPKVAKVSWVC